MIRIQIRPWPKRIESLKGQSIQNFYSVSRAKEAQKSSTFSEKTSCTVPLKQSGPDPVPGPILCNAIHLSFRGMLVIYFKYRFQDNLNDQKILTCTAASTSSTLNWIASPDISICNYTNNLECNLSINFGASFDEHIGIIGNWDQDNGCNIYT